MNKDLYKEARKRVERQKKFYRNLSSWLGFSLFFFVLNMVTSPGRMWFIYPVAAWGLGVFLQWVRVFGFPGMSRDWETRKMEEEIQKMEMEERLRNRYIELSDKKTSGELLDGQEKLDLEELKKMKRTWDDSELV